MLTAVVMTVNGRIRGKQRRQVKTAFAVSRAPALGARESAATSYPQPEFQR